MYRIFGKSVSRKGSQNNAICRIAKAIPVGRTPQQDHILLVLQGALNKTRFNGGWFVVICDELGLDELHQDLEDFEREARDEIREMISQAEREANEGERE
jgi:hypothetical protein